MLKKFSLGLVFTLLALGPAWSGAQDGIPAAVAEALAREAPLGQADVDAYIKIIPGLKDILKAPQSANQIAANLNLSQIRFSYIMAKVPLTMALVSGADPKSLGLEALPQALHPAEEELLLVKTNLEALLAAADKASRTMTEASPGATAE